MKQEEKNKRSREHILSHAFTEFATQGYRGASINTICSVGQISKGLLYHYYTDKDTLYLACVERCFKELTEYLSTHLNKETVTPDQYFDVRLAFFQEKPLHQSLFCDTVLNPPPHLSEQLSSYRTAFDTLNKTLFTAILEKETLAQGIRIPDAIRQLQIFENSVSLYLKNSCQGARQIQEHNQLCKQTFHTLLYGLIART